MGQVVKADFYYGVMLSAMMNNKGIELALLSKPNEEKRKIYELITNKEHYVVYTKYNSSGKLTKKDKRYQWQFLFSKDEVNEIKEKLKENSKLLVTLICANKELDTNNCEIVLVHREEFERCIDINNEYRDSHRITVRRDKNRTGVRIYGDMLDDIKEGRDTTIMIPRERLSEL